MDMIISFLTAAIVAGTPLLFATLGEILTEKVGNLKSWSRRYDAYGSSYGFYGWIKYRKSILAMLACNGSRSFWSTYICIFN